MVAAWLHTACQTGILCRVARDVLPQSNGHSPPKSFGQVESGRVKVLVSVEEREQTLTEQLLHDELEVRRVPWNVRICVVPGNV
jgi:hypothetical protein